ncbi:septal ring lytic transglycosylase RlpA family protein [Massilia forsythiae]|uniref:Endolytic peptidoglycan transglycosylase RlpA n=2 Tax=Massilia forsythiae TaxID=2728020 RepID=A0A7Z2W1I2_9BURK|nr:septal ring lytic transglycosylase RlpA family protein [Massilia forsythiae]
MRLKGVALAPAALVALAVLVTGCAGSGERKGGNASWSKGASKGKGNPALPRAGSGRGGYYQDDGPGANPPPNLDKVPDAVVRYEPYARAANRPYEVFGQNYVPMLGDEPFSQRGVASWYGVKFHGQRTSSGEPYDMYAMTAAHPTLPIPSYVRITSLESGQSVVLRVNDRGPFHAERIIDVSYTAAYKLGLLGKGSHQVQLERLFPDGSRAALAARAVAPPVPVVRPLAAAPAVLRPVPVAAALPAAQVQLQPQPVPVAVAPAQQQSQFAAGGTAQMQTQTQTQPVMAAQFQPLPQPQPVSLPAPQAREASFAPAPTAGAALKPGFYLQLGAFGREDKAQEIGALLRKSGMAQAVEVEPAGTVNRVLSGPFDTRDMALDAARDVPASLGLKPIVVRR